MNGRAAKNMALQLARGVYKGVKNIKKGIVKAADKYENKLKSVDNARKERDTKMIEDNWGNTENYDKMQ
jgi:hypothetical protein